MSDPDEPPCSSSSQTWTSTGPEQTLRAARELAGCLGPEGLAIALIGELGAGKTLFAKGLAAGLGIDPSAVTSPTFTIASEYTTADGRCFAHVDLYRIESAAELAAAGFDDLLEPGTILVVEWADRHPQALPADRLELGLARRRQVGNDSGPSDLSGAGDEARQLTARALGPVAARVLERWWERLEPESGLRHGSG
jgi:tRNA threonylcarbamoyl adenosine modification protein YjeE